MPKTQAKSKLDKITTDNITINIEDLKPKETASDKIRTVLDEMKTNDSIVGYILQNSKSACIDLNEPAKIIEYALLSSSTKEAAQEMSQMFNLGEIRDVLIEGQKVKLLSLTISENEINVFVKKETDHENISKTLSNIT